MTTTAEWRKWNAMQTKPITNADRIRAMSDEELAEFMWAGCDNITQEACKSHAGCVDCWLDWLKEEVDDG